MTILNDGLKWQRFFWRNPSRLLSGKPEPTIVSDSEYTYVYQTSSDDSDVSQDKSIDKAPHQSQVRHPLQLGPETIPKLPTFDTLELQARVIMSKACDPSISPAAFNEYLLKNNFHVWNAKELTDSKPYRMLCVFGPPNVGKSSAAGGMNTYVQGVQVTTTSKKFYKYIIMNPRTPTFTTSVTIRSHPLQASIGIAYFKASTASLMVLVATLSLSKVTGCSNVIPSWTMQITL